MDRERIFELEKDFRALSAKEVLKRAIELTGLNKIALASSFSIEDQVLTHMLMELDRKARIFTLDTGRLHQETYDVMDKTAKRYNFSYEICFPDAREVAKMMGEKGPNSFYESIGNRKECCAVRKVAPLRKKLSVLDAWITGLRREQSVTRSDMKKIEYDETFSLVKFNPLADWSEGDAWGYIKKHQIPYNALHDRGFPSIGCAPCTRAIEAGEDIRAGRWWWENPESRECGLHIVDGKLVRRRK